MVDPATLDVLLARAKEAWPDIVVAPDRFTGEVVRRLGTDATTDEVGSTRTSIW